MNKYALYNLMESLTEARCFEYFLNELKDTRKETPELFINAVLSYAKNANERDRNYLFYRIDLSDDEQVLMFKHALAKTTPEDLPALASVLQNRFLDLARNGKRVSAEFLKLDDAARRDALEKIKFNDEEINWLCSHFRNRHLESFDQLQTHFLFPAIQWKLHAWVTIGLISFTPNNLLTNLSESLISEIENNTNQPGEIKEVTEKLIKTIRGQNILTDSQLSSLVLNKKKVGRAKAYLNRETGEITGSLDKKTREMLEAYNDGKNEDEILALCYPIARTLKTKKKYREVIKKKLRETKHLQLIPYPRK